MELTIEQIKDIEEMSAALLPPSEIAILIDIPSDQHNLFCEVCKTHKSSPIYAAYQKGNFAPNMSFAKQLSNWLKQDHLQPSHLPINIY